MNAAFDLALVFGRARAAGVDQKAVVLRTFAVALLHLRVVHGSGGNGGFEIIQLDALRDTAKEGKGVAVEQQPGRDGLVVDKLDILVATKAENHDKQPHLAEKAGGRVGHATGVAEIDLGFLTRGGFNADGDVGVRRPEGMDEAAHGGIAAGEAAFGQALVNGGHFSVAGQQVHDEIVERGDRRTHLGRRWGGQRLLDQALEVLVGRQGRGEELLVAGPGAIAADGAAINPGGALDGAVAGGFPQVTKQFTDIHSG